jgi:hypothetical protein
MKRAYWGILALLLVMGSGRAQNPALDSGRAQSPSSGSPVWLDLGNGRGYYDWILVLPGVRAKTDVDLYLKTYDAVAKQSSNNITAAQAAAAEARGNAEQRVKHVLEQFSQHDPAFFKAVMEKEGLTLVR